MGNVWGSLPGREERKKREAESDVNLVQLKTTINSYYKENYQYEYRIENLSFYA